MLVLAGISRSFPISNPFFPRIWTLRRWLQYHDRDTGDLCGMLPLAIGMKVALTHHIDKSEDKLLLKGTVGRIHSWVWHANDPRPSIVYVKFEGVKWQLDGVEEPGVYPITPLAKTWFLDSRRKPPMLKIYRTQVPLTPAYAMTAHSSQGKTLQAVLLDLNVEKRVDTTFGAVAASRAWCADPSAFSSMAFSTRCSGRPAVAAQDPSWRRNRLGCLSWGKKAFCNMQPVPTSQRHGRLRVWTMGESPVQPDGQLHVVQVQREGTSQAQVGEWHHQVRLRQMQGEQDRGLLPTCTAEADGWRSEADMLGMLQGPWPIEVQPVREGEASGRLWRCDGHIAGKDDCLQAVPRGSQEEQQPTTERMVHMSGLPSPPSKQSSASGGRPTTTTVPELRFQEYQTEGWDDLPQRGLQAQVWGEASPRTAPKALLPGVPSERWLILKLMMQVIELASIGVPHPTTWASSAKPENSCGAVLAVCSVKLASVAHVQVWIRNRLGKQSRYVASCRRKH